MIRLLKRKPDRVEEDGLKHKLSDDELLEVNRSRLTEFVNRRYGFEKYMDEQTKDIWIYLLAEHLGNKWLGIVAIEL